MRTMIARTAALLAVSALLFACGGSDPMADAIKHQEAMLDLLEKNKDNPEAAGNAVEEYTKANEAALKSLAAEGEKLKEKFASDPEGAAEMVAKHAEKMGQLTQRMMKLATEHPELMANEKVQAASKMLGGGL